MEKRETRDYTTQSTRVLLFTAMFMGTGKEKPPKVRRELRKVEQEIKARFPEQYITWKKSGADYKEMHTFFSINKIIRRKFYERQN